jgi:hypothetical protein
LLGARDLPRLPRRYGQWAGAVLLVLITVLAAGWLWQQKSDRVEVLAAVDAVPPGDVIQRDDLRVLEVAGIADSISASEVGEVVGKTATVGLVPGQILNQDMLTTESIPAEGERVVGLELDATRAPEGLVAGDVVTVVAVPPSGEAGTSSSLQAPAVLAETARVESIVRVEGAGTRLALVVPEARANRMAAYGAAGRVAVVQAPTGGER